MLAILPTLIVEVDPEIETALSSVIPGVTWKTWEPFYMKESANLVDTWVGRVRKYLEGLAEDRISSQMLKKAIPGADKVAPSTWTKVLQKIALLPNKGIPLGKELCFGWSLEGRSLVRQAPIDWGADETEVAV